MPKKIVSVDCPACLEIQKTNSLCLIYQFDVRKRKDRIKGLPKWKDEIQRHYGVFHPQDDIEEAKEYIKSII